MIPFTKQQYKDFAKSFLSRQRAKLLLQAPMKFKKRKFRPAPTRANANDQLIYGWHSATAVLNNPRRQISRVFATQNAATRLAEQPATCSHDIEICDASVIGQICGPQAVHQGVAIFAAPLPAVAIEDLEPCGLVVLLDQVTDPHNVGAIIRTCAAFNVKAVIMPQKHSPKGSPILTKTASGGVEHVAIIEVTNLARAMDTLKAVNFTLIGLDSEADSDVSQIKIAQPLGLVLGAEGKGLRQKTRNYCDLMARLDMPGTIKSLNVSNAAAICLSMLHTAGN